MKPMFVTTPRLQFHIGFIFFYIFMAGFILLKIKPALLNLSCPTKQIFSIPCFTCGSSRALQALFKVEFANAFLFNSLFVVGISVAVILCIDAGIQLFTGYRFNVSFTPSQLRKSALVLLAIFIPLHYFIHLFVL